MNSMLGALLQDPSVVEIGLINGHQKLVALTLAAVILVVVVELVRKRKLREEYAVIWVVTSLALMLLAWQHKLLNMWIAVIGAAEPASALFFGAILFLVFVALQFSVRLSKLTYRSKALTQRIALLETEIHELREHRDGEPKEHDGAA